MSIYCAGTVTGRLQTKSPNIPNISKTEFFSAIDTKEQLWYNCRKAPVKPCETCHERFQCWTADHPMEFKFINMELDYAQMETRILKTMSDVK